ncbi:MAG: hydrogenase expression/formation protein HypE [Deltaproteobacteria bacterium]|nr:hydrogenase expression/formation protein HypE [Deltaproteobacteria bacterium]
MKQVTNLTLTRLNSFILRGIHPRSVGFEIPRHEHKTITLSHGAGGSLTHKLISDVIIKTLGNVYLNRLDDSAVIKELPARHHIAFTTDAYIVEPVFFPGGDIGRLAVCGTVNDLSTAGAVPKYLSLSLIIEAGFDLGQFKKIVVSIKEAAEESGVKVVTGDTKVLPKERGGSIYINTSGIGFVPDCLDISSHNAKASDVIIVSGTMGDHEAAILNARENLQLKTTLKSDVAPINHTIAKILKKTPKINCLKDLTRGGLAGALIEIATHSRCQIQIDEQKIPVRREVAGICDLVGLDPLYLANEGKFVVVCAKKESATVLSVLKKNAAVIGEVTSIKKPELLLKTAGGGIRRLHMMSASQLPRIC